MHLCSTAVYDAGQMMQKKREAIEIQRCVYHSLHHKKEGLWFKEMMQKRDDCEAEREGIRRDERSGNDHFKIDLNQADGGRES